VRVCVCVRVYDVYRAYVSACVCLFVCRTHPTALVSLASARDPSGDGARAAAM